MKLRILTAALAVLLAPAAAAAQSGGSWWSPVAERLPADQDRPQLCRVMPDLPACTRETAERDRDRDGADRERSRRTDRDDDRWERDDDDRRRGNGPPFCRNGQGHPVHGLEWCRDKGWDDDLGWRDVSWEDVILGPRDRTRERGGVILDRRERTRDLDRGGLLDVLGEVVLGRLDARARQLGGGSLDGRLIEGRTRVLQVRAGGVPVAELLDADRDGRVDRVLVRGSR